MAQKLAYVILEGFSCQELAGAVAQIVSQFPNHHVTPAGFAAIGTPDPKVIGGLKVYQALFLTQAIPEEPEKKELES